MKAATGFGGDFLKPEERKILERGKSRRAEFASLPLSEIMRYTHVELKVLARIMTKMREGLREIGAPLNKWHGAGSIAEELLMRKYHIVDYYPEDRPAKIDADDRFSPDAWALRAYFGGRPEMIKQGVHDRQFWNYDVASAYPHVMRSLPTMRNGRWRIHSADELATPGVDEKFLSFDWSPELNEDGQEIGALRMTPYERTLADLQKLHDMLKDFSLCSMVRVRFRFPHCRRIDPSDEFGVIVKRNIPWFPLPIRADDGTIYFPHMGQGVYMVEEVRAMLRWAMRTYENARPDELPLIAFLGAMEFVPANDCRPFETMVERLFAQRAEIVNETRRAKNAWEANGKNGPEPYDVREKIIKLGLNSLYGKMAQSKGATLTKDPDGRMQNRPPKTNNMFYAAAITAGTRAMLCDAASADPDAIILFATDGICSIRELSCLEIPEQKRLGAWESSPRRNGVFVKSGLYTHEPCEKQLAPANAEKQRVIKMRGVRPANLEVPKEQWFLDAVPQAWASDAEFLKFEYRNYMTFGAALASRESWKLAGHWIDGTRKCDVQVVSKKRDCSGLARTKKKRGERERSAVLFDTTAAANPLLYALSRPFSPEWLDEDEGREKVETQEQEALECKGGFGFDMDE